MTIDLNPSNISNQAGSLNNTNAENIETSVQSIQGIKISEGLSEISEEGGLSTITFSDSIPSLEAPSLPLEEVLDTVVKIDAATAQLLGVSEGVQMNIAEFNKAVLDKIDSKFSSDTGNLDVSKMDAEALDLYCLLLTQSSKEKMIETFKTLLTEKKDERNALQNKYNKELAEVTQKNVKATEMAKAAEKKAKKIGIFKAVLSAAVAVVTTAVALGITIASLGTASAAAAIIGGFGVAFAVAGCYATVATSGVTIAALCTEDPEKKATLNKCTMGLGIASAALGIVGAIMSGGASFATASSALAKILNGASSIASGASQITTGALDITEGTQNIKLAKLQRKLADMKIDLTKLDADIETINKFIEILTNDIQDFVKNLLMNEQEAAKELINISDAQANLSNEVPC